MMNIKALRAKRIALGISQKQAAEYLGKNKMTVNHYELGRRQINKDILAKYNYYINGCMNGWIEYQSSEMVSERNLRAYPKTREGYLILGTFE